MERVRERVLEVIYIDCRKYLKPIDYQIEISNLNLLRYKSRYTKRFYILGELEIACTSFLIFLKHRQTMRSRKNTVDWP